MPQANGGKVAVRGYANERAEDAGKMKRAHSRGTGQIAECQCSRVVPVDEVDGMGDPAHHVGCCAVIAQAVRLVSVTRRLEESAGQQLQANLIAGLALAKAMSQEGVAL